MDGLKPLVLARPQLQDPNVGPAVGAAGTHHFEDVQDRKYHVACYEWSDYVRNTENNVKTGNQHLPVDVIEQESTFQGTSASRVRVSRLLLLFSSTVNVVVVIASARCPCVADALACHLALLQVPSGVQRT